MAPAANQFTRNASYRLPPTGTPRILIIWAADKALADSLLPSFARAIEDSLIAHYKFMTIGAMSPVLIRARRAGADSVKAFVSDSTFAYYKSGQTSNADGRMGLLNLKFFQQVCAAGVDVSGADMVAYIYNSNPYFAPSQLGEGSVLKPAYESIDTTATLCGSRTVGWYEELPGCGMRWLWSRSDGRAAISFELAHEATHVTQLRHSPGSENITECGTPRTYGYGHYSIMRSFLPFARNTTGTCVGDFFPYALPDQATWWSTTTTVTFDVAGRFLRDLRKVGPILKVPLDSLTDEHYLIANVRNQRFDSILHGAGLGIWRVKTKYGPGVLETLGCRLWDIESAVGRFTSGSPDPVSGLDSLDFFMTSAVPDTLKDYPGSGNDLYDGTAGQAEMHGNTNPSTQAWSGTTRTSARNRYSNVAIKNIVTVGDSVRADIWVGYDTLTVTSVVDSTNDGGAAPSPNGLMVAWTRGTGAGRDIYAESIENHSDRFRMGFTNDADMHPSWHPLSDRVAFASDSTGQFEIYTGQYNGLGVAKLTTSTYGAHGPAWSTKGDSIVYLDEDDYGNTRIMKVGYTGGTPRPLTRTPDEFTTETGVSWSPDAAKLSFLRNDSLYTMNAVGGGEQFLVTGANVRGKTSWSPDGDWIVYEDSNSQLRRVKISDTGDNRRWTTSARGRFTEPSYQPWGTRVGVTRLGTTSNDIWTYRFVDNEAPVLDSVGTKTVNPSSTLTINLSSTDPDGDPVSYNGFFLPAGASFSGNTFTWTPSGAQAGLHYVKFRVVDLVNVGGAHKGGADHEIVRVYVGGGGGCPFVDTKSPEGWVVENSILGRSLDESMAEDLLQLKFDPVVENGLYNVRIRENEMEETTLDHAQLVAVDHSPAVRVLRRRGDFIVGNEVPAFRVTDSSDTDITSLVDGSKAEPYVGEPGETLTVELVAPALRRSVRTAGAGGRLHDEEEDPPVLNSGGKEIPPDELRREALLAQGMSHDARVLSSTGIVLQVPDGNGGWRDVERHYPRADYSESVPDSALGTTFRMVFVGRHQIRFIGRFDRAEETPTPVAATLSSALHSRLGTVSEHVASVGSGATSLVSGDTLALTFAADPPAAGHARTWFLRTKGVYTTVESEGAGARGPALGAAPVAYSLGFARPNPSRGNVTLSYALAKAGSASLRIYDTSGRLVRTLVDSVQPAGTYEIAWDWRDAANAKLGSGVYFYRFVAGSYSAKRKVVLLSP